MLPFLAGFLFVFVHWVLYLFGTGLSLYFALSGLCECTEVFTVPLYKMPSVMEVCRDCGFQNKAIMTTSASFEESLHSEFGSFPFSCQSLPCWKFKGVAGPGKVHREGDR